MSTTMDRRLANRRYRIREADARRRLRRSVIGIVTVAVVGLGAWFVYQSPYLTVREIVIDGQVRSSAHAGVKAAGVSSGIPTINVNAAAVEAVLLQDPWIATARVTVVWPGSVAVLVVEHHPAAWVEGPGEWMLSSSSGIVVVTAPDPDAAHPRISVGSAVVTPGSAVDDAAATSLAFVTSLPDELRRDAIVIGSVEELTAVVGGYDIVLGYGVDMEAKARATAAILAVDQPEGAVISVVSPERPAVKLQSAIEARRGVLGRDENSG